MAMSKRTCSIEGCGGRVSSRGWCRPHYNRWYRYGDPLAGGPGRVYVKSGRTCTIEDCARPHYGGGLCNAHYQRKKRGAPMNTPVRPPVSRPAGTAEKTCTYGDCTDKHFSLGFCSLHYSRHYHGTDMDAPRRVRLRPGEFRICATPECENKARSRGLCARHYMAQYERPTQCKAPQCDSPEHAKGYCQPHYGIMQRFNISPEVWEQMYAEQGGRCAICDVAVTRREVQTDHDHACCEQSATSCGACVRGLLCFACNSGLGRFKDSRALLAAASMYLLRHENGDTDAVQ